MHHPVFDKFKQHEIDVVDQAFQFNFLGVATRRYFVIGMAKNTEGKELSYPTFSEEYFEWIDILESVIATDQQFVMIELGAGYGRWLVIAAVAVVIIKMASADEAFWIQSKQNPPISNG